MTTQPPSNLPGLSGPGTVPMSLQNSGRHPLWILAAGVALTVALLGTAGWYMANSHRDIMSQVADDQRLQELRGTILQLDEVLTMSARMAAATGDARWEERYRQFEPVLDAAIKEAIEHAPEAHEGKSAAQTDAANLALVRMESEAFALVRQGKREAASQILFSDEYEQQKLVYVSGMQELERSFERHTAEDAARYRQQLLELGILMLGASVVLVSGWIAVFIAVRTHLTRRVLAERALEDARTDLELRVEQRTEELALSNRDLMVEIIEHQHAAEQLRKAKEQADSNFQSVARLKAAIEAATETIVITDTDGVIQYANPAFEQVSGYMREEAIGANPRVFNSGEHDQAFYQELWDTVGRGEVWRGRFTNRKKDGTIYYEDATISPIRDETGEIINYVAVKRDVTLERTMQSQLLQAQKMESIGQLAAGIAHEINTPIQYVGDNTRFVRDSLEGLLMLVNRYSEQLDPNAQARSWEDRVTEVKQTIEELDLEFLKEEIPKALEQSLDGVARVAEIVRAMKDFSHPGGEEKTPTDLNKAIESTITVCRNRWKYVADLKTDFEVSLPTVPCLVGEFNQVILNIIVNAADAIGGIVGGEAKGQITIRTRQDDEFVEIRISDTGGGIPDEIRNRVFDPFFTTKDVGKGTGQGLAISHDVVVNKHGGTIDLETEPGKGSTFIIRLPITEPTAERQKEAA